MYVCWFRALVTLIYIKDIMKRIVYTNFKVLTLEVGYCLRHVREVAKFFHGVLHSSQSELYANSCGVLLTYAELLKKISCSQFTKLVPFHFCPIALCKNISVVVIAVVTHAQSTIYCSCW